MFKQLKCRSVLGVIVLVLALGVVGPLGTALAATPYAPDITVDNCTVTVQFTAGEGQIYRVYFYDDSVIVYDETKSAAYGELVTFQYTFTTVGQIAPGIAILIDEYGQNVYFNDLSDFDCTPEAALVAVPGCDVLINVPATAVVGSFVSTATLYYDPGAMVQPATAIPAGNTAWVFGQDASEQYYKILWVCDLLWVEKGTMGPNYDAVWNGKPLPTGVVK